jgi:hypothetical protein
MRAVLLALVVLALCLPPVRSAPAVLPVIKADLSPVEQSLNASSNTQNFSFSGRVALSSPAYVKYEVFLRACDDTPWSTHCSPDYFVFWGSGSGDFNISIVVPGGSAGHTAKIWVESRATFNDNEVAGNISAPVFLTIGAMPANGNQTGTGDARVGNASPGPALLPAVLIAAIIIVPAVSVYGFFRRRRKRDGGAT